ncbi:MAG: rRNA adenine N-6-methyltransferase family protein [Nanoarchaeota archaeon]
MIKYDQHFLTDNLVVQNTIQYSNISNKDIILEIGCGKGILTREILKQNPKQLISIEIDDTLKGELKDLNKYKNFKLIFANALFEMQNYKPTKLIANIPYSSTETIYKQIIRQKIPFCILLQGSLFYKKIQNNKSRWSLYIKSLYHIDEIQNISGDKFSPPTKTKSSLIKLTIKQNQTKSEQFITNLFFNSNSKVKNAIQKSLVQTYNLTKKQAKEKYNLLNLDILLEDKKLDIISNNSLIEIVQKLFKKVI